MGVNETAQDPISCKYIIGGMAAFIMILIAWIKALMAENKEGVKERIADLKEQYKRVKTDV